MADLHTSYIVKKIQDPRKGFFKPDMMTPLCCKKSLTYKDLGDGTYRVEMLCMDSGCTAAAHDAYMASQKGYVKNSTVKESYMIRDDKTLMYDGIREPSTSKEAKAKVNARKAL